MDRRDDARPGPTERPDSDLDPNPDPDREDGRVPSGSSDAGHSRQHSATPRPDGGTAVGSEPGSSGGEPTQDPEATGNRDGSTDAEGAEGGRSARRRAVAVLGRAVSTLVRLLALGGLLVATGAVDTERRHGLRRWLLLEGNRWAVIVGIVAVVFATTMALAVTDVVGLAKTGFVVSLFGGVVGGLFSFVPIVISVNQLAVSRLSGTPRDLREDVDEVRDFRAKIEEMYAHAHPEAGTLVSPTNPDAFLDRVVSVVADRATDLEEAVGDAPAVEAYVQVIRRQLTHVHEQIEAGDGRLIDLLVALMGDDYSSNVNETRRLRARFGGTLPEEADRALDDLEELFVSLDVLRGYYKSMYIQTVLSRLSRLIVYSGVGAFLLSAFLIVLFAQGPPSAPPLLLDLLVSAALAVATAPFAVLSAYVVRIAVIAERTAAPGAFTPPSERPSYSGHREV
jgi:hypothetical protein